MKLYKKKQIKQSKVSKGIDAVILTLYSFSCRCKDKFKLINKTN